LRRPEALLYELLIKREHQASLIRFGQSIFSLRRLSFSAVGTTLKFA
jgi:hypothetical protein